MEFTEARALLSPDPLYLEMGVERLPSGQLHVAARTDMHGCEGRMLEWWFGWGPLTREYAWWHPIDHVSSEWEDLVPGNGVGSTHVVAEKLGGDEVHSLRIRFHDPAEIFGEALAAARERGDVPTNFPKHHPRRGAGFRDAGRFTDLWEEDSWLSR